MTAYYLYRDTPLGGIVLSGTDEGIESLYLNMKTVPEQISSGMRDGRDHPLMKEASRQLTAYFNREMTQFTVPLLINGTEFQRAVWNELTQIPYGETRTYGEIAKAIGKEKAVRAVGQANKANTLPIFIPCHRVMGKNQKLTGYAGKQIEKKEILLQLEGSL